MRNVAYDSVQVVPVIAEHAVPSAALDGLAQLMRRLIHLTEKIMFIGLKNQEGEDSHDQSDHKPCSSNELPPDSMHKKHGLWAYKGRLGQLDRKVWRALFCPGIRVREAEENRLVWGDFFC